MNSNKNIRLLIFLFFAAFSILLILRFKNPRTSQTQESIQNIDSTQSQDSANSNHLNQNLKPDIGIQGLSQEHAAEPVLTQSMVQKEKWFHEAALNLDVAMGEQSEQIDKELRLKAKSAGASDLKDWKMKSMNPGSAQNERILATYLIGLADDNISTLVELAVASLPDTTEHSAHSPELQKQAQEKAIRTMAIDALYDRALKDKSARTELENLSKTIQDHGLRSYAERKFRQLK